MGCPVCGRSSCDGAPHSAHLDTYPFLPGGRNPLANQLVGRDFIYAPHAVYDRTPGVERCIYGAGDVIPMSEAIRLGLVEGPVEPKPERARKPGRNRIKPRGQNRAGL